MATKALNRIKEREHLEKSLELALSSIKGREEEASLIKDVIMDASNQYFERVREQVTLFYMKLDLSQMDQFQVVRYGQLVDGE